MTFEIDGFTPAGVLGRGGFGTVYRAADDAHGREVAIKVLGRIDDDSARRRFDRERRAMGTLSGHPNIGVVYTSGFTASQQPYIVMEMIRGGSLGDRLDREGPLPAADVRELGITLADALEHAHQGGVLHLDLKPENILMSRFGTPKIVDFGIAALVHEESSTAAIRATPSFADPEVLEGRHGTVRSDVYGLAATLFTLLSGAPPYSEGSGGLYQIMRRVALDPVPTVERVDVPRGFADVLHRAMAKDPNQRPASMAEFAAELRAVGDEPVTQRRPGRAPVVPPTVPAPVPRAAPPVVPPVVVPEERDPNRGLPITPPPRPGSPSNPTPRPVLPIASSPAQPPSGPASPAPSHYVVPSAASSNRPPRTALIGTLAGAAVIAAILVVVLAVTQRRENPTTASVPVRTLPVTPSTTEVAVTIAPVAEGLVPDVIGADIDAARDALAAGGYVTAVEPHCFDEVAGQVPIGGTELDAGGTVELLFEPCVVPDFVGLRLPSARSIVEDEFVTGLLISWPEHCDDVIIGQSIPAFETVAPGTNVELELRTDCG